MCREKSLMHSTFVITLTCDALKASLITNSIICSKKVHGLATKSSHTRREKVHRYTYLIAELQKAWERAALLTSPGILYDQECEKEAPWYRDFKVVVSHSAANNSDESDLDSLNIRYESRLIRSPHRRIVNMQPPRETKDEAKRGVGSPTNEPHVLIGMES
ncbi:hypothetical protein J6590_009048 [Homalodisca vitripennis]|nr:hypothetical protein J6590_009048 [Homalodisca vitripennis]